MLVLGTRACVQLIVGHTKCYAVRGGSTAMDSLHAWDRWRRGSSRLPEKRVQPYKASGVRLPPACCLTLTASADEQGYLIR